METFDKLPLEVSLLQCVMLGLVEIIVSEPPTYGYGSIPINTIFRGHEHP